MNIIKRIVTLPSKPFIDLAPWEKALVFPIAVIEVAIVGWLVIYLLTNLVHLL